MSKNSATALGAIFLAIVAVVEHQARTKLHNEIVSIRSELQQLAEQLANVQQDNTRISPLGVQPGAAQLPENELAELMRLRAEINLLRQKMAELEQTSAAISNHIASATGANEPFVYPDSRRKKDYTFTGYAAPQSALQSVLWAITQS